MAEASAYACWLVEPGRVELRTETLPGPTAGQVRVRALHSGISRGTETLVYRGEVPVSEYERMRAPFQSGDFPGPVKYGYSSVGIVEEGPATLLGRAVFCLFPHQSRYVVPVDAVHVLPDGVPPARAVLTGVSSNAVATDTITIEPTPAGSRLTWQAEITLAWPARLLDPVLKLLFSRDVAKAMANLERELSALATRADASVAGGGAG